MFWACPQSILGRMHQKNIDICSTPQQFKKIGMRGDELIQVLGIMLRNFEDVGWPVSGVLSAIGQNAITFIDHQ
jgi:hypothetical protein